MYVTFIQSKVKNCLSQHLDMKKLCAGTLNIVLIRLYRHCLCSINVSWLLNFSDTDEIEFETINFPSELIKEIQLFCCLQ